MQTGKPGKTPETKAGRLGPGPPSSEQFNQLLSLLPETGQAPHEIRLHSQLEEYASQYTTLKAEWNRANRKPDLNDLVLPPPSNLAETQECFDRWHRSALQDAVNLDAGLQPLQLRSEGLVREVIDAGCKWLGGAAESLPAFALERLLRRQSRLRCQRAALLAASLAESFAATNPRSAPSTAAGVAPTDKGAAVAVGSPASTASPPSGTGDRGSTGAALTRRQSFNRGRRNSNNSASGGTAGMSGVPAPPATQSHAQKAVHLIDSELEFGSRRLRHLQSLLSSGGRADHQSFEQLGAWTASQVWRGSAAVLVRQLFLEDSSTKDMRHFLFQLQYLGISQRVRIWRKSLDHRAVMETACEGSSGGRHRVLQPAVGMPVPPLLSIPLGPTNRKRLERSMQELGASFKLQSTSFQPDRGRTFAHQVGLMFPEVFQAQQKRWHFRVCPVEAGFGARAGGDTGGFTTAGGSSSKAVTAATVFEDERQCYLRPSDWAEHLPWRANLDPEIREQHALLRASFAQSNMPSRSSSLPTGQVNGVSAGRSWHRAKPSYAKQMIEEAVAQTKSNEPTLRGLVNLPGGGLHAVDSLLAAEMKALQLADVASAVRRCSDAAEKPVGGPGASDASTAAMVTGSAPAGEEKQAVPSHLLRGSNLLRCLQCRSQRWRLLGTLNYFRFVQRRLLAGQAAVHMRDADEGKGSIYSGDRGSGDAHQRVEEKAQEKYWDISSRSLSRILKNCSLPFADGSTSNKAADLSGAAFVAGRRLDREETEPIDGDYIAITDGAGRRVLHEAALEDLECLELEMLTIGSYFIHKYEATSSDQREVAAVDRAAVLYDLLFSETWFNTEKRDLLEVYLGIFEQTTDRQERHELAQRITDVIAMRPRLDLQESYFVEAYAASIMCLRSRTMLLKELFAFQVVAERNSTRRAANKAQSFPRARDKDRLDSKPKSSFSAGPMLATPPSRPSTQGEDDAGLAHFREGSSISGGVLPAVDLPLKQRDRDRGREKEIEPVGAEEHLLAGTACLVWKAELLLEEVHRDLVQHYNPPTPTASTQLERACYVVALERWRIFHHEEASSSPDLSVKDDPDLHLQLLFELGRQLSGQHSTRTQPEVAEPTQLDRNGSVDDLQAMPASPNKPNIAMLGIAAAFGGVASADRIVYDMWIKEFVAGDKMQSAFRNALVEEELQDASVGMVTQFQQVMGKLLAYMLQAVHLRHKLQDSAYQVNHLNCILGQQAVEFGTKLPQLEPCLPSTDSSGADRQKAGNNTSTMSSSFGGTSRKTKEPRDQQITAGLLAAKMASLDFDSADAVLLNCSPKAIEELQFKLQHELAFRGLALACAQQNALLLDPQIRVRELNDIGFVGLSRDALASDGGLTVIKRLRESLEISGHDQDHLHAREQHLQDAASGNGGAAGDIAVGEEAQKPSAAIIHDMSRYSQYLQHPARYLEPICTALALIYRERTEETEGLQDTQLDLFSFELLRCSSLLTLRAACELCVGLQAAQVALEFMGIATLLPPSLSPFTYGDKLKPLVERDGSLGPVYSIPTSFDVLMLKALPPISDMATLVASLLDIRKYSSIKSVRSIAASLAAEERAVQRLDITYSGPACSALRVLHGLSQLVLLRYALCSIDGDPVALLEAQRDARFKLAEPEGLFKQNVQPSTDKDIEGTESSDVAAVNQSNAGKPSGAAAGSASEASLPETMQQKVSNGGDDADAASVGRMGRSQPSFEALEDLCSNLGRLGHRLDDLGPETCRKPAKVLAVLDSELRCAHRQLAVVLRWATRGLIREGGQSLEACALRCWSSYLEEGIRPVGALPRPWMLDLIPPESSSSSSLHPFASAASASREACLASWNEVESGSSVGQVDVLWPQPPKIARGDLIACTSLHEDGPRFLAVYHPQLLHREEQQCTLVQALLGRYAGARPLHQQSVGAQGVSRFSPSLPWLLPEVPMSALASLALGFSAARRQHLSAERAALAERQRVMLLIRNLEPDSDRAVDAEAEFFGLWLLRERLQEVVVAGQLVLPGMPTEGPDLERLQAQLAANIPPDEPALPAVPAHSLGPTAGELSPDSVGRELESVREQLSSLVPSLSQLLIATASEKISDELSALASLQLRIKAARSALSTCSSLQAPAAMSHKSRLSTKEDKPVLLTRGPYTEKLDGVLRPISHLRTKSTYVRMNNDEFGERAHVLKEMDLNVCMEDLVAGLWSWGRNITFTRERRTEEILGFLTHQQEALKSRISRVEANILAEGHLLDSSEQADVWLQDSSLQDEAALRKKKEVMEAKYRTATAAKSCGLVFEVDRLHLSIRDLKATVRGLEKRLEGEVMDKVRGIISSFTGALAAEAGRFHEGHHEDAHQLARKIRQLREHATSELAGLAAKNQASQLKASLPRQVKGLETLIPDKDPAPSESIALGVQGSPKATLLLPQIPSDNMLDEADTSISQKARKSIDVQNQQQQVKLNVDKQIQALTVSDGMYGKLNEVASRDDLFFLQQELTQLKNRQVLARMFHHFKCQAMRQRFEQQVQALEATLESNSELLESYSEVNRAAVAAGAQFKSIAQDVSTAEKRIDELRATDTTNAEQRRRLAKWKQNKIKQLFHMRKGVREHQMAGTVDVAALLQQMQEKQELVTLLEQQREESESAVAEASKLSRAITSRVKKELTDQRRVKEDTFRELQHLRAEMQKGPVDEQKRLEKWHSQLNEVKHRLEDLEEENMRLRILSSMQVEGSNAVEQ